MWRRIVRKRWATVALIAAVTVALVIGIFVAQEVFRNMMQVSGLNSSQFNSAKPGNPVEIVLDVTSLPSDESLVGSLLEPTGDTTFERTSDSINVTFAPDTKVMMGQLADVKAGAVVQIDGQRDTNGVKAQRFVILTDYVSVN